MSWDHHIQYLQEKLNLQILAIKRIRKFIPTSEYIPIYQSLFVSHLTYCISAWGGVGRNKLQKLFSIQKRCLRILFGTRPTFDHSEFYETCARTRTYELNMCPKNYVLEHTKPLFVKHRFLTVHNLYNFFVFMEIFKVLKSPGLGFKVWFFFQGFKVLFRCFSRFFRLFSLFSRLFLMAKSKKGTP